MQNIFLPLLLGTVFGWVAGVIKKGGFKFEPQLNRRALLFFFGGIIFGITGKLGIDWLNMTNRILTTVSIVSILYLALDYFQAKASISR